VDIQTTGTREALEHGEAHLPVVDRGTKEVATVLMDMVRPSSLCNYSIAVATKLPQQTGF